MLQHLYQILNTVGEEMKDSPIPTIMVDEATNLLKTVTGPASAEATIRVKAPDSWGKPVDRHVHRLCGTGDQTHKESYFHNYAKYADKIQKLYQFLLEKNPYPLQNQEQSFRTDETYSSVFVVAPKEIHKLFTSNDVKKLKYCATTRRNNNSLLSFPGGKLNPGESLIDAAKRECAEEGWLIRDTLGKFDIPKREPLIGRGWSIRDPLDRLDVPLSPVVLYGGMVEGNMVAWLFAPGGLDILTDYKEKRAGIAAKHASISDAFCNMQALDELQKAISAVS